MGLEAAMTLHRALSVVTMPAFDTEIVCCSIASWIEVRSWGENINFLIGPWLNLLNTTKSVAAQRNRSRDGARTFYEEYLKKYVAPYAV